MFRATIIAFLLAGVLLIFRDYGMTWDEWIQAQYGEKVLTYFLTLGADVSCNQLSNTKFYGPFFDLIAASITQFYPDLTYEIRHLLNALFALATLIAVFKIAIILFGQIPAYASCFLLLSMPRFFGHAFNNPKDIPFACLFTWTMYFLIQTTYSKKIITFILLGILAGLCLSVRVGGLPIVAVMGIWQLSLLRLHGRYQTQELLIRILLVTVLSWLLMVAFWPWAHQSPIANPIIALRESLNFRYTVPVFFEGLTYQSHELPRYYLLKYLSITIPVVTLLFAILGLTHCFRQLLKQQSVSSNSLLLFWFVIPVSAFYVLRPNAYDGIRQFIFILPAIALFAGNGVGLLLQKFPANRYLQTLITIVLASTLYPIYSLHPYQTTYFNKLAGGLKIAGTQYETDYWLNSYREAILWLAQNRNLEHKHIKIAVAGNAFVEPMVMQYLPDTKSPIMVFNQFSKSPPDVDYYISIYRFGLENNYPDMKILYQVQRENIPFAVVKAKDITAKSLQ